MALHGGDDGASEHDHDRWQPDITLPTPPGAAVPLGQPTTYESSKHWGKASLVVLHHEEHGAWCNVESVVARMHHSRSYGQAVLHQLLQIWREDTRRFSMQLLPADVNGWRQWQVRAI